MTEEKHYINTIYYQLEQTAKYCRSLGTQLFKKLNTPISMEEFTVLDTIKIHGEICQRDLAKLILKDRPNTGRLLNSLEKKGYIVRYADTKNNRLVRKTNLTPEGEKVLEESTKLIKNCIDKLPKGFSKEKIEELKDNIIEFRNHLINEVEMNI